jgi:hypothetical protein
MGAESPCMGSRSSSRMEFMVVPSSRDRSVYENATTLGTLVPYLSTRYRAFHLRDILFACSILS